MAIHHTEDGHSISPPVFLRELDKVSSLSQHLSRPLHLNEVKLLQAFSEWKRVHTL